MSPKINRHPSRRITVGEVPVGGGAPIAVQSMTNTDTRDVEATAAQIRRLEQAGCEIIRVAVPDEEAARAIAQIQKRIRIPLIADIHFDYRLAIASARAGADGLRINPGNIGSRRKVKAVVDAAAAEGISIRIGVNAGSLEKDILNRHGAATEQALVESALRQIGLMDELGFSRLKLSIKSSDVGRTVAAYRMLAEKSDIALHVGITEAGGLYTGIVKSAMGIGMILAEGIGDTIRVSLTRDPVEEVRVGYEILKALGIRQRGPVIISCPTCGRCRFDLFSLAEAAERELMTRTTPITIAIMGCPVNGPGEARAADIGIAGGKESGVLFKRGRVVRTIPQEELLEALLQAVDEFESNA
ncbi:MAG TPA: flavodoxin-dependent (E)-4-hydroxy-3-methylbut-2-enyl-diphosphate synthase [Desulfosalsimonadaceae bacterium]|nr:flavodoxin-dependent (E)-4-hydroxy-3-methylbut-2-enyl-diphosphate synthase [Desulfosalsimonadaceae bacterium]